MTPTESLKIVLPIPPSTLGGNGRGHSRWKAAPFKRHRELAEVVTKGFITSDMPWPKCRVSAKFFFEKPTKEADGSGQYKRDQENFMMRLKAYYDGFVDAGICPNDDWAHMRKTSPDLGGHDKENPRVEFTIERIE